MPSSRLSAVFSALLVGASGCGAAECPAGTVSVGDRCVDVDASSSMDAGPRDAFVRPDTREDAPGLDAYEPDSPLPDDAWAPDAGTDGGPCSRCPVAMPACFADGCVECTTDDHCIGAAGGPACDTVSHTCVACNVGSDCTAPLAACLDHACVRCDDRADCSAPTPACIANACVQCESRADCAAPTPACTSNACVQCEMNMDCPTAGASRCAGSTCGMCMGDGDCTHIAGSPRCVAGTCRACTVAMEMTDCGINSCNPATNTCTGTRRGSRTVCDMCFADSECGSGLTCAAVNPARGITGNYCLPIRTGAFCVRPYFDVNTATSASGAGVTYCRHRATTCEALLGYAGMGDGSCAGAGGTDASCGATGVMDGLCRLSGGGNLCTHRCSGVGTNSDCADDLSTCIADPADTSRNICSL